MEEQVKVGPLLRPGLPDLPRQMRGLPIDERGYPIPWFVAIVNGKPDFRVTTPERRAGAVRHNLCWVCGTKLQRPLAFVIGPMCAVNRISADPPAHVGCAIWSAQACPFLSRPKAERREANLPPPEARPPAPGIPILRNPGVALVWVTDTYRVVEDGSGGWLLRVGHPRGTLWFAEGRKATREEVLESIRTGLPILEEMARAEGPDALAELSRETERAMALVPA